MVLIRLVSKIEGESEMNRKGEEYRFETTVTSEGTLVVKGLPFPAGTKVEVIIHERSQQPSGESPYPLRGKPIRYLKPFESVAENEWEILQ